MSLGQRLLAARRDKDLKQFEVAAEVGCDRAVLSHFERDKTLPSRELLRLLAHVLDADFNELDKLRDEEVEGRRRRREEQRQKMTARVFELKRGAPRPKKRSA